MVIKQGLSQEHENYDILNTYDKNVFLEYNLKGIKLTK